MIKKVEIFQLFNTMGLMESNTPIDKLGYFPVKKFARIAKISVQGIHKALDSKRKKGKRIVNFIHIGSIYLIHKSELKKFLKKDSSKKLRRKVKK